MSEFPTFIPPARQRGVALIIGLVILVVLALLGASAYSVATQDERIAGNARDRSRALDAAETMLRNCEYFIQTNSPAISAASAPAIGAGWTGENPSLAWPSTASALPTGSPASWSWETVYSFPNAATINPEWSQAPQCIAEGFVLSNADRGVARAGLPQQQQPTLKVAHVTARGYGLNTNTNVTLVSYVAFY
jgi:Tfp pilus assembly protein PilX